MGPEAGPAPALLGPEERELRALGDKVGAPLPDVEFGQTATRINPTKRDLHFTVPLTDGDTYLGDIELTVSPQDLLSVDAPRLLDLLKPILVPKLYARLAGSTPAKGQLDQTALAQEGIRLSYDANNLALAISIPVDRRETRSFSFGWQRGTQTETISPAGASFYLNIHAAAEIAQAGRTKGFIPPTASLDGAIRLGGLVAEGEGYLSGRRLDPVFRRTGSRLVYDDMRRAMRWTAGDSQILARQFQASPTVAGLGFARIYNEIDPQREIRASGAQSFSVLNTSVIETIVNGRSVERRTFQPGNYTLRDLPVAEGSNMVKLRIEDAGGKVRFIDFSVYANQLLLAKGITEFAAFGGVYSRPTQRGFAYSRQWVGSGFVRRGLTEQVTAGVSFQGNARVKQAGAEVLWGSPIGLTGFNLTGSTSRRLGTGLAFALTYERLLSRDGSARSQSFRAAMEWRSKRFDIPDVEFGIDRTAVRASAGYVMTFGNNAFVAADAQYARDRNPGRVSYGARLSGGIDVTSRIIANTEAGFLRGSPRNETYLRLGMRIRLGERATAQVDADSMGRGRATFSDSGGSGNGSWQTSADVSRQKESVSLSANASMLTNRAELGIQQTAGWERSGMKLTDARVSLRAAFAVAFADGALALGRPVSEAFVIARRHHSLRGKAVYLDPVERSEMARSGALGPALAGQFSAHSFRTVIYQVPDAPSGYDLGAGNIAIRPPYRGGYKFVIGSDYNLLVIGKLLDGRGEPVRLLAGKAIDLGNPRHPQLTVFTSRDGRFGAQGLRPGRWRIEMPGDVPIAYEFEVSNSPDGTVRLGELKPVGSKGE